MSRWEQERATTDEVLAARTDMSDRDTLNERSVRWDVAELVGEYARHNGHAAIIRERIDGQTRSSRSFHAGPDVMEVMLGVDAALDPRGILDPGGIA